jgi:hypothetical protein
MELDAALQLQAMARALKELQKVFVKLAEDMVDFVKSCFAAGTPLLTPDGSKPIEAFRPGDLILAAPEHDPDGPVTPRRVEEVFRSASALLSIEVNGRSIETTTEHPFWVAGKGWTKASELAAGDVLRSENGEPVTVLRVADTGKVAPVYNLRVADDHTYFVGCDEWGFSVWAHNASYYHGTDIESALSITMGGIQPVGLDDFKFNMTDDPSYAAYQASLTAAERNLPAAVVQIQIPDELNQVLVMAELITPNDIPGVFHGVTYVHFYWLLPGGMAPVNAGGTITMYPVPFVP